MASLRTLALAALALSSAGTAPRVRTRDMVDSAGCVWRIDPVVARPTGVDVAAESA